MALAMALAFIHWRLSNGFIGQSLVMSADLAIAWKHYLEEKYPRDSYSLIMV